MANTSNNININDNNNNDSSAAAMSSTMSKDNRYSAFVGPDDQDDSGGGVLLRDFEDDTNPASTPMGTATSSSASSNNSRATDSHKNSSAGLSSKLTDQDRRNTMAPIGTGRYQECYNTNTGAALDVSVDAWLTSKIAANANEKHGEQVGQAALAPAPAGFAPPGAQDRVSMTPNTCAQMTPGQGPQYGFAPGQNFQGGAMRHPESGNAMGYQWSAPPAPYSSGAVAYSTPQTVGYNTATQGVALGANLPSLNPNTTPSHAPKFAGHNLMTTPGSGFGHNQFNRTEPRNFAPRQGVIPTFTAPPPAFSLGREITSNNYGASQQMGPDSDPFMSPRHKGPSGLAAAQAMVLPSVPENNQLALVPHQTFYGPVPPEIRAMRSAQLNKLTEGPLGMPTSDVARSRDNFPFMESASQAVPVSYGVVKIRNIPFGARRAEIVAFLGRNSKILNDNQEPVHIIMERVSSKTQDCYVEFVTRHDAERAVERHQTNLQKGRPCRLGDRPVEVTLSSQSALMQDLFPLASGVVWDNGKPIIQAPVEGQPWKTFKGFVTEEEMTMLVKHVEIPHRSPYSKECPQRPYECMISTIKKLPWYMSDCITLRQRHAIYEATVKLIGLLQQSLQRDRRAHETVINEQLLKRLVTAAMLCPGFSVVQKDNVAAMADMDQERARMFNQPRFADQWVHLHAVCPRPGVPLDVLEWYVAVVREETARHVHRRPPRERAEILRTACYTPLYFGYLWYELNLPAGRHLDDLSLREIARRELAVLDRIVLRACPPAPR